MEQFNAKLSEMNSRIDQLQSQVAHCTTLEDVTKLLENNVSEGKLSVISL